MKAQTKLKIVHVLRAPLGGLYRHVLDVCEGQIQAGHSVGIICDSSTFDAHAQALLDPLGEKLELGVHKVRMARALALSDLQAYAQTKQILKNINPDVVHGHGAKGGAYARLCAPSGSKRIYTPHGGSLHYKAGTPAGLIFGTLEKILLNQTDVLIFESHFARNSFEQRFGYAKCPTHVIHNGLKRHEFIPIPAKTEAADFLFIGELRALKGLDVLIKAFYTLAKQNSSLKLAVVGSGPDESIFKDLCAKLNLNNNISFHGRLKALEAFPLGKCMVVPSRAESLPYIVLETIAAHKPIICSNVGGIPEILGTNNEALVPADDVNRLAHAMQTHLQCTPLTLKNQIELNVKRIENEFSQETMVAKILAAYS